MKKHSAKPSTFLIGVKTAFTRFLLKKKHHTEHLVLKHNTIYIFPSKLGVGFLLVTLLNFVLGINYQNNLILVMAYLMLVVMILALLKGYNNAQGLHVGFKKLQASYSPASPQLWLELNAPKISKAISFIYNNTLLTTIDEVSDISSTVQLSLPITERGKYRPTRLKLLSQFPFGLVSVWSYMQLSENFYVYPKQIKPNNSENAINQLTAGDAGVHKQANGIDEFESLKVHQQGMNINRVSWKHYAKTQQLMVKEFVNFNEQSPCYDFNKLQGNTESRLSQLSYLITKAQNEQAKFNLILGELRFLAANMKSNEEHYLTCLQAISRYKKTSGH